MNQAGSQPSATSAAVSTARPVIAAHQIGTRDRTGWLINFSGLRDSPGTADGNGIVTVGPDLQSATVAAILLESACQQQLLTRGYGGWATWSEDNESLSKRKNIYGGSVQSVWDYLVRRLET